MNFNDLKKEWLDQPLSDFEKLQALQIAVQARWAKQQRKTLFGNIFVTVAFLLALVTLAAVYVLEHTRRSVFFSASLGSISILIFFYLITLWKGLAFDKDNLDKSSVDYIEYQIDKLKWQKKNITTFGWIYAALLWLSFMFYCYDVTATGSLLLQIGAPAAITVYIFGLAVILRQTKLARRLKEIEELISLLSNQSDQIAKT